MVQKTSRSDFLGAGVSLAGYSAEQELSGRTLAESTPTESTSSGRHELTSPIRATAASDRAVRSSGSAVAAVATAIFAAVAVVVGVAYAATGSLGPPVFIVVALFGVGVIVTVAVRAFRPVDDSGDERPEIRSHFDLPTL